MTKKSANLQLKWYVLAVIIVFSLVFIGGASLAQANMDFAGQSTGYRLPSNSSSGSLLQDYKLPDGTSATDPNEDDGATGDGEKEQSKVPADLTANSDQTTTGSQSHSTSDLDQGANNSAGENIEGANDAQPYLNAPSPWPAMPAQHTGRTLQLKPVVPAQTGEEAGMILWLAVFAIASGAVLVAVDLRSVRNK